MANKERVLIEVERIKNMASSSYLSSTKQGGTWTIDDLLQAIQKKAEKVERLLNE